MGKTDEIGKEVSAITEEKKSVQTDQTGMVAPEKEPEKPRSQEEEVAHQLYIDVVCLRAIMQGTPRLEEIISGIKTGEISLVDSGQYYWEFESEEERRRLGEAKDYFIRAELKRRKKITPEEFQNFHLYAYSKDLSVLCLAGKDNAIMAELKIGKASLERAEKLRVSAESERVVRYCQKYKDRLIKIELKKKNFSSERPSILFRMGSDEIKKQIIEKLLKIEEQKMEERKKEEQKKEAKKKREKNKTPKKSAK